MPFDIVDLPLYFEVVERAFDEYSVPPKNKLQILTPFLSKNAQNLVVTLQVDDRSSYPKFKAAVLREFALTPNRYRDLFWKAVKNAEETYVQYAKRLETVIVLFS